MILSAESHKDRSVPLPLVSNLRGSSEEEKNGEDFHAVGSIGIPSTNATDLIIVWA